MVRGDAAHAAELVEREGAVEALEAFVRAVAMGRGGTLVVEGPPGIGKSQLLRAADEVARGHGLQTSRASGAELESELPFVVVRALYDDLASKTDIDPDAVNRVLSGGSGDLLGPPNIGNAISVLYRGVAEHARREPLLFIVDDVQWADPDSLRALHYLARRIRELPLGLILGKRPSAVDGPAEDLVELADEAPIRPGPLSLDGSKQLLTRLLRQSLSEHFVSSCHGVTSGNPLLLHELARELITAGHPPVPESVLLLGSASVARTALNRVGRLTAAAVPVARAVAVLGQRASTPRVARLTGLSLTEATEVVSALVNAQVLTDSLPLGWVHPLVASALYRHTPAAERARLHAAAARLLDDDSLPVGEVGAHLLHAEPSGDPWVVDRLRIAAYAAASVGGIDHGRKLLRRALDEPAGDIVGHVLLDIGQLEMWSFGVDALQHLSAAFDLHPDPEARCGAALGAARLLSLAARWSEALTFVERALALLELDDRGQVWTVLASERLLICNGGSLEMDRYRERTEEIAAIATPDSYAERVAAVHQAIVAIRDLRPREEVLELLAKAWGGGKLLAEQGVDSPLWIYVAWQSAAYGDRDGALEIYRAALQAANRHGIQLGAWQARVGMAWLSLDAGDLRTAGEAFAQPLSDVVPLRAMGRRVVAAGHALIQLHQGDVDAATDSLAPYANAVADPPDRFDALVTRIRGLAQLARNDLSGAIAAFEALGAWCQRHGNDGPGDWAWGWRAELALALARAGETPRAIALAEEELERARAVGIARVEGAALRALAAAASGEKRVVLLTESAAVLEGDDPLQRSEVLLDLALLQTRAGDREGAREAASTALALADAAGASPLRQRALAELHQLGARPRRAAVTGVEALTAAERRVAELVAHGLTNREVAIRLVVSEKTVEKHLSSTFRKLSVTQRHELGQVLPKQ